MIGRVLAFCCLAILSGCVSTGWGPALTRAEPPDLSIIVARDAAPAVRYAAEELQLYLGKMRRGMTLPIVDDAATPTRYQILVGQSRLSEGLISEAELAELGEEGYVLRSKGKQFLIAGGAPRGTLYGVYGLLEDHLGCKWFTPEVEHVGSLRGQRLPRVNERKIPILENREPFVMDCFDGDWAARNRMNGNTARLEEKHGGKVVYFGFVHTFDGLLPPDQYFDAHPEYYSLIDGQRQKEQTQLCCTNPDVVRLVTEEVRKRMREHPEAKVFSVSQNDRIRYCQCDNCTALAEAEGTQAAPVLFLVNSVAKAVAAEFPDKLVDTLAYQYTRKPPKTMRPEPNVVIRLCSIECCFAHPFTTCDSPENKAFVEDVVGWGKICNRLWVWDYVTSFAQYFVPFPNLRVRDDNIRFLEANNVKGIFEQDVYTTLNGEFSALSGYLGAKLLWDPNYGEDRAINEFLEAVYGDAAKPLRQYLDLIHDKVQNENIHFNIWITGSAPFLTEDLLRQADKLFDEAEWLVSQERYDQMPKLYLGGEIAPRVADKALQERVRVARLSIDYAIIELERRKGLALYVPEGDTYRLDPAFVARVERFFEVAKRNNVTALWEGSNTIETYKAELDHLSAGQSLPPRAGEQIEGLQPGLAFASYDGSWNDLPDFAALPPAEQGIAPTLSTGVSTKKDLFGLCFTGYFHAPKAGLYMFHLNSNDGSRMYLGDQVLIEHGGLHKLSARSGTVSLGAGYHPITIEYFESSGDEGLELQVQGPDLSPQAVPAHLLWYRATQ